MADKLEPARFEMKEVSVSRMGGDERKTMRAPPHACGQGQIKQVVSNNKSASPVRRHLSETTPADTITTTTTTTTNDRKISPTRRNQSASKLTPAKSPRQRARRSTVGSIKGRLKLGLSTNSQASTPRKLMAPCTGIHTCSGCQRPIKDRYLLGACDKYWHEDCLKCDRCHAKLGELGSTLYERANMNLCRQDYLEMFGQKAICAVCDKLIYASEMVMRARDNVYHLECFACQLCGLRFCIGDRFHLCENKIVCQYDYDEHICPVQATMFDYTNTHPQFSNGSPLAPNLSSTPSYQQSVTTAQHLDGYMSMLASNSQTDANQIELTSCEYSQSMLLESNHEITNTTSPLEQVPNNNNNILEMLSRDHDQQTTGERVELTILGSCEPLGKSDESEMTGLSSATIVQPCELEESFQRDGNRPQTE